MRRKPQSIPVARVRAPSRAIGASPLPPARTSTLSPRDACRALSGALEAMLDEGVSDFSSRTAASRRRMAALCFGFVRGEELSIFD